MTLAASSFASRPRRHAMRGRTGYGTDTRRTPCPSGGESFDTIFDAPPIRRSGPDKYIRCLSTVGGTTSADNSTSWRGRRRGRTPRRALPLSEPYTNTRNSRAELSAARAEVTTMREITLTRAPVRPGARRLAGPWRPASWPPRSGTLAAAGPARAATEAGSPCTTDRGRRGPSPL